MVWVDRVVEEIQKRFKADIARGELLLIRDEKTLSGPVHVGSLRGIVLHALVAQVLREKGITCTFKFELNDADPMDGLPQKYEHLREHMGEPLFAVPSPEDGHENYPMVFGDELKDAVAPMQLPIEWYTLRPLYERGVFNDCTRDALDHAKEIRMIYAEVSGGKKPLDWFPVSIICEQCGKVGTTKATEWDPKRRLVWYRCEKQMVAWAEGCGYEGEVSPFNEKGILRSKLPWKVEWAAKWKVFGVKIEGAGKDHSAAGGSRAIAARISEEVFKSPNPLDIPYEFFNIGGKKMSASKGLGATAKDIADLLPPMLLKLLMIRKAPNQPIDFDPEGTTIPTLFDEYDRLSDHYFDRHPEPDPDYARTFHLAQINFPEKPKDLWQMRFTTLSFVLQMPHLSLQKEAEKLKGSALSNEEKEALKERSHYVGQWLKTLAPAEYKYEIVQKAPEGLQFDAEQRKALKNVCEALSNPALPWEGPVIHEAIHAVKADCGIAPKRLFDPLYQMFLGRSSGPQVGWFLSTFARKSVLQRLNEVLES